jgi:3-hydroxyisobutyrate dehydrogenase
MRPNTTWAQMATIGVAATEQLHAETEARRPDVIFVDAPVSGSREPAESGELLILASGAEPASGMLEPVFDALGKRTMWLGPVGAGGRMKLLVNTWLAFQTEGAAESAALAEHFGIDPRLLLDALHDNSLASGYALAKLNRMVVEDYRADFALDWALKDLDRVAFDAGVAADPIAVAIADRWRDLVQYGGASGLDVSAARLGLGSSG